MTLTYLQSSMMLGSGWERYGGDSRLSLDTMMASMKTTAVQSPQCGSGSGHTEFRSFPSSKIQILGHRDLQASDEPLDNNASSKTPGYLTISYSAFFCLDIM